MPRPKVDPSKRRRVAAACTYCRASKRRCNAQFPCTNCVERGRAAHCTAEKTETLPNASVSSRQSVAQNEHRNEYPDRSGTLLQSGITTNGDSPTVEHRTRPQMLRDSQGERGELIVLAYLVLSDNRSVN